MFDLKTLKTTDKLRAITGEHAGTLYPIARFRERTTPIGGVERVGVVVYDRY